MTVVSGMKEDEEAGPVRRWTGSNLQRPHRALYLVLQNSASGACGGHLSARDRLLWYVVAPPPHRSWSRSCDEGEEPKAVWGRRPSIWDAWIHCPASGWSIRCEPVLRSSCAGYCILGTKYYLGTWAAHTREVPRW